MISDTDFLALCESAQRSLQAILKLEEALTVDLTSEPISEYLNQGDIITIHLLDMAIPEDEEMDAFVQSYWNLIQKDTSILKMRDGTEHILLPNPVLFYNFWAGRQDNFPIECEVKYYDLANFK